MSTTNKVVFGDNQPKVTDVASTSMVYAAQLSTWVQEQNKGKFMIHMPSQLEVTIRDCDLGYSEDGQPCIDLLPDTLPASWFTVKLPSMAEVDAWVETRKTYRKVM